MIIEPTPRPTKQVLVVRKDLKMRKGKIGAQCAHAAMKVMLDLCSRTIDSSGQRIVRFEYNGYSPWARWLESGSAKVCVYVNSEQELIDIYTKARSTGLPSAMIVDSGRTEFNGVPTRTVVAVGPAWVEDVDEVTGHLPLY
ncbi:MAG: aminoacyl-tRNA hydrolase [Myxococcales bacterium]|nr:aminoacyl-tRNA hydrolase [Myxococcales bacterium]